jgi:hypothetical protein
MGAPGLEFQTWESTKDLRLLHCFHFHEYGCPGSGFSDPGKHEPK